MDIQNKLQSQIKNQERDEVLKINLRAKIKKMTIFNWLNQILFYKKGWTTFTITDQKAFQPYMINRFLSMNEEYVEIVNYFQKYSVGLLESKEIYKWYCAALPKRKQWNKYIKGKAKEKYESWVIDIVKQYYEISEKECIDCLELLYGTSEGKMQLKIILEMHGIENKKIKKLKLEK